MFISIDAARGAAETGSEVDENLLARPRRG